jgi:hypothetical protein
LCLSTKVAVDANARTVGHVASARLADGAGRKAEANPLAMSREARKGAGVDELKADQRPLEKHDQQNEHFLITICACRQPNVQLRRRTSELGRDLPLVAGIVVR